MANAAGGGTRSYGQNANPAGRKWNNQGRARGRGRGNDRWTGDRNEVTWNFNCYKCGAPGHFANQCRRIICFNCNQPGHMSKECGNQRGQQDLNGQSRGGAPDRGSEQQKAATRGQKRLSNPIFKYLSSNSIKVRINNQEYGAIIDSGAATLLIRLIELLPKKYLEHRCHVT